MREQGEDPRRPPAGESAAGRRKRPYRPPRLEVYGDIAELTRAVGDKGADGVIGSNDGT